MRILLLSILAVGIIGVMVPSVFGDEEISISTDKMQYGIGDRIKITGEVSDTIKLGMGKLYANVYLYDPDDFQLDYEQVEIRPNGQFGHVITAGERILIDKELSNTKFRVLLGPFNDIKKLEESFNEIKPLNFENLEILKDV